MSYEETGAGKLAPSSFVGKLIIATAFYQCQAHSHYTGSLVATATALERAGIKWDFWPVNGDFHVERAVNELLYRFVVDEEATDILIIDSDESWELAIIFRLLAHPQEVVGCSYRMKNNWAQYTASLALREGSYIGKVLADGTALMAANRLPGGFLRIKKSALLKFIEKYPDEWFWAGDKKTKIPMFFNTTLINHTFTSCDFVFSEKLKACGVDLWCDPNADISHYGLTGYPGNLDKKLRQDAKEKEAFATVKKMANAA